MVNPRGSQAPPRARPTRHKTMIMKEKRRQEVYWWYLSSTVNNNNNGSISLPLWRRAVARHGDVRSPCPCRPHQASFLLSTSSDSRIKIQLTCVSPLVQLRKKREKKKGSGFFYSILVLVFLLLLVSF